MFLENMALRAKAPGRGVSTFSYMNTRRSTTEILKREVDNMRSTDLSHPKMPPGVSAILAEFNAITAQVPYLRESGHWLHSC